MSTGGERKGKLWEERVVLRVKKTWFIVEFRGNTRCSLKYSPMGNKLDVSYSHKIRTFFLYALQRTAWLARYIRVQPHTHVANILTSMLTMDKRQTDRQTEHEAGRNKSLKKAIFLMYSQERCFFRHSLMPLMSFSLVDAFVVPPK